MAKVIAQYAAASSIMRDGVEMYLVGDPAGAQLDSAIKRLLITAREDGPELWGDLLGAAKALRWRLTTQPQPLAYNEAVSVGIVDLQGEVDRLRGVVGGDATRMLDALARAADAIGATDPPVGPVLRRCIAEVGGDCVVMGESQRAVAGIASWLTDLGAAVVTPAVLRRADNALTAQAYVVGPPHLFGASLLTAPPVGTLSFLFPGWCSDRTLPQTLLAPYAAGAIRVPAHVYEEGEPSTAQAPAIDIEDEIRPRAAWAASPAAAQTLNHDDVVAHKVLLSGGLAIYLDAAGDRIRALDPKQPPGERVLQVDVQSVRPGTCLVLREGQTEPRALYDRALAMLGNRAAATEASQENWKAALRTRLDRLGPSAVERALHTAGVRRAGRAAEWVEPTVARPQADADFEGLLRWLGLPLQPAFTLATNLRRLRLQASADIREQLERAVSDSDLSALERDGYIRLDLDTPGFRGIIATRVLAISQETTVVAQHEARLPFADRSAKWLE